MLTFAVDRSHLIVLAGLMACKLPSRVKLDRHWDQTSHRIFKNCPRSKTFPMKGSKHSWMSKSWDPCGVTPHQLQELGVSSVQELQAVKDARVAARKALCEYLARPDASGPDKQRARCAFINKNMRLPYQCPGCWLLPGNCVCNKLRKAKPSTKVVIHVHHDEWGRGSNTGCLCARSLSGCELLMKGHAPHDEQLEALLADPDYTTALLWPGDDALEPHQLQELAATRSNGRIALVAVDATWGCAVKMRRRYPEGLLTVRLPPDLALPQLHRVEAAGPAAQQVHPQDSIQQADPISSNDSATATARAGSVPLQESASNAAVTSSSNNSGSGVDSSQQVRKTSRHIPTAGERVSLFRGVRKYHGKAADNGRVSTLEAVAAALLALEGDEDMYRGLLHNLKLKVDAMRQQKHMPLVYGIAAGGEDGDGDGKDF